MGEMRLFCRTRLALSLWLRAKITIGYPQILLRSLLFMVAFGVEKADLVHGVLVIV